MGLKVEPWKPPGANEVEMAAVVALFRQGLAGQEPPEERTAVSARSLLETVLGVPKTGVLVARGVGGRIEGMLILRNEPPAVRIVFMAAREPRKGAGTALVGALREIATARGAKELRAVYGANDRRARAFFTRRMGFGNEQPAPEERPGAPRIEAKLAIGMA
jgi:GNAT superfamily N-acetyltransferase